MILRYIKLKGLLKTYLAFKILKPKLIESLGKPITIQIDALYLIMQMLRERSFFPGTLEAKHLMKCSMDQLHNAVDEFVIIMIYLVGKTTTTEAKIAPPYDMTQKSHSGLSRYASADSEIDSENRSPSAGCPYDHQEDPSIRNLWTVSTSSRHTGIAKPGYKYCANRIWLDRGGLF